MVTAAHRQALVELDVLTDRLREGVRAWECRVRDVMRVAFGEAVSGRG